MTDGYFAFTVRRGKVVAKFRHHSVLKKKFFTASEIELLVSLLSVSSGVTEMFY
jgi:hypothetical protein